MNRTGKPIAILCCAAIVLVVLLSLFTTRKVPAYGSGATVKPELPYGTYTVAGITAGGNSLENLAQIDDCIKRSDQDCEKAMLFDGRAFLVEKGTAIEGEQTDFGAFQGTVRSGALVGKEIFLPVKALEP
jgi:hypothetical protein